MEKIEVKSNQSKKTFTIIKTFEDGTKVKYRTTPLNSHEFEEMEYNTEKDWKNFLRTSQDYFSVN